MDTTLSSLVEAKVYLKLPEPNPPQLMQAHVFFYFLVSGIGTNLTPGAVGKNIGLDLMEISQQA